MNLQQKQYALKRLDDVKNEKLRLAKESFRIEEKRLSDKAKYDLISKGKIPIRKYEEIGSGYRGGFCYLYDFEAHGFEVSGGTDDEKYSPVAKMINAKAIEAKDQIMLGDCEEALRLIQELEKLKF